MIKLILLAYFLLAPYMSYANCPSSAKQIIPDIQRYIDKEVNELDGEVNFIFFDSSTLSIPPIKFLTKNKKKEAYVFGKMNLGIDTISDKPFKVKTEYLLRPGKHNEVLLPFVGLHIIVEEETLIYTCISWDDENLEQSIIRIFFLETSDYKRFYGRPVDITVKETAAQLYLYPVSSFMEIIENISYKVLKTRFLISLATKLIRSVEGALNQLQRIVFDVGVSQIEISQDQLSITAKGRLIVDRFNLLELNNELKDNWWREILKGNSIFP